jgi:hypothetical protein
MTDPVKGTDYDDLNAVVRPTAVLKSVSNVIVSCIELLIIFAMTSQSFNV